MGFLFLCTKRIKEVMRNCEKNIANARQAWNFKPVSRFAFHNFKYTRQSCIKISHPRGGLLRHPLPLYLLLFDFHFMQLLWDAQLHYPLHIHISTIKLLIFIICDTRGTAPAIQYVLRLSLRLLIIRYKSSGNGIQSINQSINQSFINQSINDRTRAAAVFRLKVTPSLPRGSVPAR
jgi:hypothetical protein